MMKLGTQTGSLQNHLYSRMTKVEPTPYVGMPATILSWTDRHPATVKEVITKGQSLIIGVAECDTKRIDNNGMSEDQEYEYSESADPFIRYFRKNIKGSWERIIKNSATGRWNKYDSNGLRLGVRQKYHDYSF